MKRYHRSVHAVSALLIALCGAATLYVWPDLRKDVATDFGTLSGFATFYGLVFTIIEVVYTRGAAEQASAEARRAADHASAVFDLRNISECLSAIENVLDQLHDGHMASSTLLSRVVKMYSAQFPTEIGDAASLFRGNLDAVDAYMLSLKHTRKASESAYLRQALLRMTSQLSAVSTQIKGRVI